MQTRFTRRTGILSILVLAALATATTGCSQTPTPAVNRSAGPSTSVIAGDRLGVYLMGQAPDTGNPQAMAEDRQ